MSESSWRLRGAGTVRESGGEPLAGCVEKPNRDFEISGVPPGSYTLGASASPEGVRITVKFTRFVSQWVART